jgi:hypothetical protein
MKKPKKKKSKSKKRKSGEGNEDEVAATDLDLDSEQGGTVVEPSSSSSSKSQQAKQKAKAKASPKPKSKRRPTLTDEEKAALAEDAEQCKANRSSMQVFTRTYVNCYYTRNRTGLRVRLDGNKQGTEYFIIGEGPMSKQIRWCLKVVCILMFLVTFLRVLSIY